MPDFKLYCRAIVTDIALYWHRNRHINQLKGPEDPKINP
jgi:hypothetical protein